MNNRLRDPILPQNIRRSKSAACESDAWCHFRISTGDGKWQQIVRLYHKTPFDFFLELCVSSTCLVSLCVIVRAPPWRTALASRPPLNLICAGSRAEQRLFGRPAVWKWLCCGGTPVRVWRSERGFCCSSWLPFPLRVVLQLREIIRRREIRPWRGTRAPTIQLTPLLTKRLSLSCPSTTTTSGSPSRSLCGSSWHCWWSLVSETWSKWMNEWIIPAGKMINDLYPSAPFGKEWPDLKVVHSVQNILEAICFHKRL